MKKENSDKNSKSIKYAHPKDSQQSYKMLPPQKSRLDLRRSSIMFLCTCVVLSLCLMLDTALCDYENTWNFYYEQPCCSNPTGFSSHHVRHHRGEWYKCLSFWFTRRRFWMPMKTSRMSSKNWKMLIREKIRIFCRQRFIKQNSVAIESMIRQFQVFMC